MINNSEPSEQSKPMADTTKTISIVLTRRPEANQKLAKLLNNALTHSLGQQQAQRIKLLSIPLIDFGVIAEAQPTPQQLAGYDWLLLTSPQAAKIAVSSGTTEQAAAIPLKFATVGQGTAAILRQAQLEPDFMASQSNGSQLAQELPAQLGEKILHPTSQLSGKLSANLTPLFEARGLSYQRHIFYHTVGCWPQPLQQQQLAEADLIVISSGSAAQQLARVFGRPLSSALIHKPLAVMGSSSARAASQQGFQYVRQPKTPHGNNGLKALAELVAEQAVKLLHAM